MAVVVAVWLAAAEARTAAGGLDPDAIGEAADVTATVEAGGVVRVAWPRDDVPVAVGGTPWPAAAGLAAWTTLTPGTGGALLVAEAPLFDDEVTPAVDAALARGLAVTGLANRLPAARPPVQVLHLEGEGDALALAAATKAVWDAVRAVRERAERPAERPPGDTPRPGSLDTGALEKVLGAPLRADGGTASAIVPRDATLRRRRLGGAQGVGTRVWLVGGDDHAAIAGEIATATAEVQAVVRGLRAAGLHLTSLHGHLVGESPALLYAAFWGTGPARQLVTGLRATLDAQRAARR